MPCAYCPEVKISTEGCPQRHVPVQQGEEPAGRFHGWVEWEVLTGWRVTNINANNGFNPHSMGPTFRTRQAARGFAQHLNEQDPEAFALLRRPWRDF